MLENLTANFNTSKENTHEEFHLKHICSPEEWAGDDPFCHPSFILDSPTKNPDPTTAPARGPPRDGAPDQGSAWQLLETVDKDPRETGPPPKPPNSPLHRALIPCLRATELWPPASHCQHLTNMVQYEGKRNSPPPEFSLESHTRPYNLLSRFYYSKQWEMDQEHPDVFVCFTFLKGKPRSYWDANANLFLKNHQDSRRRKKPELISHNSHDCLLDLLLSFVPSKN